MKNAIKCQNCRYLKVRRGLPFSGTPNKIFLLCKLLRRCIEKDDKDCPEFKEKQNQKGE